MPELPEVETIAAALREGNALTASVLNRRISKVNLRWTRSLATPSPTTFKRRLSGQTIRDITRRGKFLQFHLPDDYLLIHLRMSGDLVTGANGDEPGKYARMVLFFQDGGHLEFVDPRKFGRIWLVDDPAEVLGNLGPEPLDPALKPKVFYEMLHSRRRRLKPLLLDQNFLAGIGNIYADEALHAARLHPLLTSDHLSKEDAARLLKSIRVVLKEGIRRNGASIDWVYRGGDFQNHFRVYQRTGEPCPRCGKPIERIVVGQRGTHLCPNCQASPKE